MDDKDKEYLKSKYETELKRYKRSNENDVIRSFWRGRLDMLREILDIFGVEELNEP